MKEVKNMVEDKKPKKDVFEKKPKESKKAKPAPKKGDKDDERLYEATDGKIKEGGLRRALKVDKDYKFKKGVLQKLLKHEEGKKFDFEGHTITMTEKLRKQIQLAINMLK